MHAVCNYGKGKWVRDDNVPLYSGFDCKQWLAPGWACRTMPRTDFSYEMLRWQPKDCQLQRFNGDEFLKRMQGKTIAFVGDSLGGEQFQSLMCMITRGLERNDVLDVGSEHGRVVRNENGRPDGWAYRFTTTNTTVLHHWSACLCDLEPIVTEDPNQRHHYYMNTAYHWTRQKLIRNRWVMHVGGVRKTNETLRTLGEAKNFTIHSVVGWVNSQLQENPQLQAFYRSISPRHFSATPRYVGKEVVEAVSSDHVSRSAVRGTGVKLLDITSLSSVRDEGHISRYTLTAKPGVQDCLHWCLPGVPDTWNEILVAQIK
ncbi:unnamed protein product [Linum tenue]|uniref:Trichome birefringence-like N-terminal domain-containing protein n=1 Tax=Linum tenue TaxID=586396 RepID=A0AAV0MDQ3_9ROSI|nr:unnamed protein product [Linum tenue]